MNINVQERQIFEIAVFWILFFLSIFCSIFSLGSEYISNLRMTIALCTFVNNTAYTLFSCLSVIQGYQEYSVKNIGFVIFTSLGILTTIIQILEFFISFNAPKF